MPVQGHRVVLHYPALGLGNQLLALFDFRVVELLDLAAGGTDEVVVVLALVQLSYTALPLSNCCGSGCLPARTV